MATDFIMPRIPGQQQQQSFYPHQQHHRQHQPYRHQQQSSFQPNPLPTSYHPSTQYNSQVSPPSTPGNASPTSPKNYITRQIRPLYVPAVLRPTEFPSKAPPTRPKPEIEDETSDESLRHNNSFMSLGGLSGLSAFGRLSRRSTADSTKSVDGSWNLDLFPKPTGAPTRKHWKPDQESSVCDHATCKRYFSYFTRRHHCRKCGNIFCDMHSAFEIPLDQDANYNPRGLPSRACDHCYSQFKEWRSRANSQSSSDSSSDINRLDTPTSPVAASPTVAGLGVPLHTPDAAHSVPRDWNWSTF
ncbi:Vacuolar segregation protein pep7 [Madurella mycetomatis]|uniref:Vacuolar segregation protein pep7 n=1 Tax=Madurella mycetomatis TaxID=100816 RepID=A0A175W682_9PEZI|nr:Vacuolar segregation protein pep7 [Madurella mycetomatis]